MRSVLLVLVCVARPSWQLSVPAGGLPKQRLRNIYEKNLKSSKPPQAPVLTNWDKYLELLPVREDGDLGGFVKLCECPFWADPEDMKAMVEALERPYVSGFGNRDLVKYGSGPSGSGKTASIAAAFCESAEETFGSDDPELRYGHYLYIACANNDGNDYFAGDTPALSIVDDGVAREQGAAWMADVVREYLNGDVVKAPIRAQNDVERVGSTSKQLGALLDDLIPDGKRILIHVDEYPKMCDSIPFRQGAMFVLAMVPRVTVVVTYIGPLTDVPGRGTSGISRDPVPIPVVDVKQAIQALDRLQFLSNSVWPKTFDQKRAFATLLFRLGLVLPANLASIHARSFRGEQFLNNLARAATLGDTNAVLGACLRQCPIAPGTPSIKASATRLLLGVSEDDADSLGERVSSLIVIPGDTDVYTSDLRALLAMEQASDAAEPAREEVFTTGRNRFRAVLLLNQPDQLVATPLEAAYSWTIPCMAVDKRILELLPGTPSFKIKCTALEPGRLFPGGDTAEIVLPAADGTIYYAKEGRGDPSHPLADLYFRTQKNELVLVDVTGSGSEANVRAKKRNHLEWMKNVTEKASRNATEQVSQAGIACYSFILAPNLNSESSIDGNVAVVCNKDARELLGGLQQLYRHFQVEDVTPQARGRRRLVPRLLTSFRSALL